MYAGSSWPAPGRIVSVEFAPTCLRIFLQTLRSGNRNDHIGVAVGDPKRGQHLRGTQIGFYPKFCRKPILGPIPYYTGLNRAGHIRVAKCRVVKNRRLVAGDAENCNHIASRRIAPDCKSARIKPILASVRPKKTDGSLSIPDCREKACHERSPHSVVEAGDCITFCDQRGDVGNLDLIRSHPSGGFRSRAEISPGHRARLSPTMKPPPCIQITSGAGAAAFTGLV